MSADSRGAGQLTLKARPSDAQKLLRSHKQKELASDKQHRRYVSHQPMRANDMPDLRQVASEVVCVSYHIPTGSPG